MTKPYPVSEISTVVDHLNASRALWISAEEDKDYPGVEVGEWTASDLRALFGLFLDLYSRNFLESSPEEECKRWIQEWGPKKIPQAKAKVFDEQLDVIFDYFTTPSSWIRTPQE